MFRACLNSVGGLLKKPQKIEKAPQDFRTLIPPDFEEETAGSSTSTETNKRSSLFNLSKKKDALPPVVSEVNTLLCEAEATSNDFAKSVELLEKATTLGSACAAAKLGLVYRKGFDSNTSPDYPSSVAYYLLALKLIYMIPNDKWDMSLLLEVIAGLSEIFRKQMHKKNDGDMWMSGIRAMKHIESTLSDQVVVKKLTQRDLQKCKAIRIHINFCLGLTAESDHEYSEAKSLYENCKRIGVCNFITADKLVDKAQSKMKELESKIPKVKPICVSCDYEPKELGDIWKLLVCSKCQVVAACTRECLTAHLAEKHPKG